jgi:hypothetical protein
VFLLGLGGMLWLSADLRDEWRELRAIRKRLEETTGPFEHSAAELGRGEHAAHEQAAPESPRPVRRVQR